MKAGGIIPPLSNSAGLAGRRAVIPPLLQARLSDTLDLHAPVKQAHSGVMGANLRDTGTSDLLSGQPRRSDA